MTTVTDADRRAAVEIMADRWNRLTREKVHDGECDHYIPVQVCARHREAAQARARLEGAEIMREALLEKIVNDPEYEGYDFGPGLDMAETHIRSLDPAAILEAHARAKAMGELIAEDGDTL